MASVKEHKSHDMGLHEEVLTGRTQQVFFNPEEAENFFYECIILHFLISN